MFRIAELWLSAGDGRADLFFVRAMRRTRAKIRCREGEIHKNRVVEVSEIRINEVGFWAKNGVGWEIWRGNYVEFLLGLCFLLKNGDFGGCDWTPGFWESGQKIGLSAFFIRV